MELEKLLEMESTLRKISHKVPNEWKKHINAKFTRTEVLVLYILHVDGRQRASALAKRLDITTGGLTGITDKLVDGGYVYRRRDTKDRRVVYLTISEQGKEEVALMRISRETFISRIFHGMSDEELAQLSRISLKLLANLEEMEQSPGQS